MTDKITYPNNAGVYKLTCSINNKVYIGKSFNINQRLKRHEHDSKKLKNGGYFQRAISKHGWDSFIVEILEIMEDFDKSKDGPILLEREAHFIRLFDSTNRNTGYNVCEYSTDRTGLKASDETRAKMSIARSGTKQSEETREKLRKREYSAETREKMRQAKLGRKLSAETKEKIKQSSLGKVMSDDSKNKLAESRTGMKFSEEHKEKLRQAKLGKSLTEEHKEALRKAKENSTYKHSEETKTKIGQSSKGRDTRKKL